MTERRVDDAERKSHYGAGRQPWDIIVEETPWAVAFAAANVLKYLRRPGKQPLSDQWFSDWGIGDAKDDAIEEVQEHSLQSARWYFARLSEWMNAAETKKALPHSTLVLSAKFAVDLLRRLLTEEEWQRLNAAD